METILARNLHHKFRFRASADSPYEIHLLTCKREVGLALWALVSWYGIGGRSDRITVHDDGTLTEEDRSLFPAVFPDCVVLSRAEADDAVRPLLSRYPHTAAYRAAHPITLKLFDFILLSRAPGIILLDSDVLVFGDLAEFGARLGQGPNVFMRDYQYAFSLGSDHFDSLAAGSVYQPINTGLGAVHSSVLDLDKIEYILRNCPDLLSIAGWSEQTLYAVLSAPFGISLLGPEYVVARRMGLTGVVAKHYVTPARGFALSEGLPAVRAALRRGRVAGSSVREDREVADAAAM